MTASGKHINQLMTADGTTFVCLGKALVAHGSSIKMELGICMPEDIGQDTLLEEEALSCWGRNKIQLEAASTPGNPSKGP